MILNDIFLYFITPKVLFRLGSSTCQNVANYASIHLVKSHSAGLCPPDSTFLFNLPSNDLAFCVADMSRDIFSQISVGPKTSR